MLQIADTVPITESITVLDLKVTLDGLERLTTGRRGRRGVKETTYLNTFVYDLVTTSAAVAPKAIISAVIKLNYMPLLLCPTRLLYSISSIVCEQL